MQGKLTPSGDVLQPPVGQGKAAPPLETKTTVQKRRERADAFVAEIARLDRIADALARHGQREAASAIDETSARLAAELAELIASE